MPKLPFNIPNPFIRRGTPTQTTSTTQPSEAQLQDAIREKSLSYNQQISDALTACIADLTDIKKLSNENREQITKQLQTLQTIVNGQHGETDTEDLDKSLITAIQKSLHDMIAYGLDKDSEKAIQAIKEGILTRNRGEKDVELAVIALSILALEALNCFLSYSNFEVVLKNKGTKAELQRYCNENGIPDDLDKVTDVDHLFTLQHWYDEIESNDLLISQNKKAIMLNKKDINTLMQAKLRIEGKDHNLSAEDLKRVEEIAAEADQLIMDEHNALMERQKKAIERVARNDARREQIKRENADVSVYVDAGQRQKIAQFRTEDLTQTQTQTQAQTQAENVVQTLTL